MDNSNIVPLYGISASGSSALNKITAYDDYYKQFLKLQGRLYKFPATVALEFFAQKPNTDCIGTEAQWNRQGYSLKTGAESVHFIDSSGNLIDYYDYSQMENNQGQPRRWMITAENAEDIKQILSETNTIPDNNTTIISMSLYCTDIFADVTECMNKLHIPQDDRKAFFSAYVNAYSLIVAGRLEVNAQPFNITPDMSFFKRFGSDVEKMTFLSYAGRTARTALKVIENAVMTYDEKRRNIDDLRNIYESDGGRTEQSNGRGTSNDPERAAEELSDIIENGAERRNPRMGSVEGVSGEQENGMVSSVQGETGNIGGVDTAISVQSVQWNVHNASGPESGEVNDRGADRSVWSNMDGLHGGELSDRSGVSETETQIPDSGKTGAEISGGIQGFTGRAVQQGESSSEPNNSTGIQRGSDMGRNEAVLRGRTGNERESSDLSDGNRLNDKLNRVFSDEETEKPSTNDNLADGFVLSDADRLIEITGSISEKSAEIIRFTTNGEYDKAVAASSELAELTRKANEIKERINGDPLTNKDVAALQDITPKRKSVKNMLDADMAKAPKFEEKLNSELGEKSPFKRLPSGSRANEDTRISVIEVADRNSTLDSVRNAIKDRTIYRGSVTNHDTGWDIQISRNGLDATVHNAEDYNNVSELDMLYSISDIVKNSVILDSAVADDSSEKKAFMHSFYGIYRHNGDAYLTKISAEEFLNGNQGTALRLHNIQSIKIEPSRHVEFAENQVAPSVLNGSDISIADLIQLVKAYDKRFFENPTAVGRTEREAEIFKSAELEDAQATIAQGEEVKTNATQQISAYGESHELTVSNAEDELREKVDTSINFPTGEMSDEIFRERLIDAIADVAQANELSLEQQRILRRFCNFATKYRLTENIIDSAFSKAPVFRTNYKDRDYLNEHFFDSKLNDIENTLNSAIQQHLTPVASENLIINFPEYNFTIDLTKSDRFVMENSYDAYVGGIDSNGHERKDNFREIHESLTVGIDEYGKLYTEKYDEANESFPYELYTYVDSQIDDLKFTVTEFIDNSSYSFTAYSVVDGEKEFEPVLKKDEIIDNREYSDLSRDAVNSFCISVNGSEADFSNMKKIDIASDRITDRNVPVSVH